MISSGRVTVVLAVCLAHAVNVCADDLQSAKLPAVLLLRNGSVLQGTVTPQGDHYLVVFGESGHVRVPNSKVQRVFSSLELAYQFKRARIDGSLESRLDLARWCLRVDLLPRAADQLLAAEVQHGADRQIETLHRRLLLATRPKQPEAPGGAEETTASNQADRAELLKELPAGAIERFTMDVQPLLLNRCATAGCHGPQSGRSLVLLRSLANRPLTRRLTERNLASTLAQLDKHNPRESPLLVRTLSAHGGAQRPGITDQDAKPLQVLLDWVRSVSVTSAAPEPETIAEPNELLLQSPALAPSDAQRTSNHSAAATSPGAYQPADPFDPAVFNLLHHGRR